MDFPFTWLQIDDLGSTIAAAANICFLAAYD